MGTRSDRSGHPDAGEAATEMGARMLDHHQELVATVARLQGELDATRAQVAAVEALAEQLRAELATTREEWATARQELIQVQRHADDRVQTAERRAEDLQHQLDDERRRCRAAEEERATVIAALGRRGRKLVERAPD